MIVADVAVFVGLAAAFAWAASRFLATFPDGYAWSEMLMNYQGGLLRRGLVGEVAYRLDGFIRAPVLITALLYGTYAAVVAYLVFGLRLARSLAGLALLVSPLGLMFPIHVPSAFGRKDVFILAVAVLSIWAIRKIRTPYAALAAVLSAYAFMSFVVETVWFYLPLIGAVFVARYRPQLQGRSLAIVAAIAIVVTAAMARFAYTMSAGANLDAMRASWAATYPGVWDAALCCVGQPLSMALKLGLGPFHDRMLLAGFAAGALLGLIPVALLLADRRVGWSRDKVPVLAWSAGVFCSTAPVFLAADWGRFLHLMITQVFVAIVAAAPADDGITPHATWRATLVSCAFLFLFATAWTLLHFQLPGQSPLVPGPLFWPFGGPMPVSR